MIYNVVEFARESQEMQDLEENFGKFIDTVDAEKLFDTFFSAIRKAYIAGYKAALNKKPSENNIIRLVAPDGKDGNNWIAY